MGKTLCFTGHRAKGIYGYNKDDYTGLMMQLIDCIKNLYEAGYTTFISGGAQGFDQLCFWAVDIVKQCPGYYDIKNIVYIPFKGQESIWAKEGLFGQDEYHQMLERADEIKIISENSEVSSLFQRNHAMVDASDGILCFYEDDSWNKSKSGTAECMRYAKKHMMDIWQICFDKTKPAPYPIKTIQENIFS